MYAVRPVRPDLSEGPVTKIVESDLRGKQTAGYSNAHDCKATTGTSLPDPYFTDVPIMAELAAINGPTRGPSSAAPPKPTNVQFTKFIKPGVISPPRTRAAHLTWVLDNPPAN